MYICDKYAKRDSRIRVFHKENGGSSSARNIGLENATGEIICFVDSDDYVKPEFLENFGDCHADITIQGYYVRNDNEEQYHYYTINNAEFNNDSTTDLMNAIHIAKNTGYLWTRAFKRKIIEENNLRFDTKYCVREDEEFIWRYMLRCNSYATINKGAYYYEMPDFSSKYSYMDIETDFECTVSIIECCAKIYGNYQHPHIVNNINRLSSLVFNIFLKKKYPSKGTKEHIKIFIEYYRKVKGNNALKLKTKIFYSIICSRASTFIHFFKYIFIKKAET